jgi:hypothetical protein
MLQRALQSLGSKLVTRYQIDPYTDRDTLTQLAIFPEFLERLLRLAASTLTNGEKIVIVCDALDEAGVFPVCASCIRAGQNSLAVVIEQDGLVFHTTLMKRIRCRAQPKNTISLSFSALQAETLPQRSGSTFRKCSSVYLAFKKSDLFPEYEFGCRWQGCFRLQALTRSSRVFATSSS